VRIVFVYANTYSWGGIQTWLLRMSAELRARGHEPILLTRPFGEPSDETMSVVERIGEVADVLIGGPRWYSRQDLAGHRLTEGDVVYGCNLEGILVAAQAQSALAPRARLVAGVFHPREYCWVGSAFQRRVRQHLAQRLVWKLPASNFVFSTDGMLKQTAECTGRNLAGAQVIPLPIDTQRLRPRGPREIDRRKIVSVARLVPTYSYHAAMIKTIGELRKRGHHFTYHVYGDGPQRAELEALRQRMGLGEDVVFHGWMPYEEFENAVGDAFLYVGMGTSLIEAGACGIPGLVAIDACRDPVTYGFLHETAGNDIGGYVPGLPTFPLAEKILSLADPGSPEYSAVEAATRRRAEEFGLDQLAPRFLEALDGAAPFSFPVSRLKRGLGGLDHLLEKAMLKTGFRDTMNERFVVEREADSSRLRRLPQS
jgi:glycosyltransferase involved in cell wall biosynthesis